MVQTMRSLEHRILFVRDLNNTRLKEVCSIYRLWLSAVRKDNTVLYNAVISAWKWTPKNKVASGCRKVKHRMLSQGVPSTQSEVLESQICASDCLMSLCEIQRNNFELAVKVEYSDLITHFLQLMQIIVTSQKVQSNVWWGRLLQGHHTCFNASSSIPIKYYGSGDHQYDAVPSCVLSFTATAFDAFSVLRGGQVRNIFVWLSHCYCCFLLSMIFSLSVCSILLLPQQLCWNKLRGYVFFWILCFSSAANH